MESSVGSIKVYGRASTTIVKVIEDTQKEFESFEFATSHPIYVEFNGISFPVMMWGVKIPYTADEIMQYVTLDQTKISAENINASLYDRALSYCRANTEEKNYKI